MSSPPLEDCCKPQATPAWSCARRALPSPCVLWWPPGGLLPSKILMILKMFSSPSLKLTCMFHLKTSAFQKWSSIWMPHMRVYTARSIQYSLIQTTMLTCTKCAWNFGPNSSPTAAGPGEPRPKKAALWVFNLQVETWHILRGWPSPQNEIFHQNCTPTKRAKMHPFL